MRLGCVIQARTGSKRLPNKIYADIGGRPMLWHVVHRLQSFEPIVALPKEFICPEDDVLARYVLCARKNALDAVMRITADCPLIDPEACRRVLEVYKSGHYDYVANDLVHTYPDGMGCEVFSYAALEYAHQNADKPYDREHVTPYLRRHKDFSKLNLRCPINGVADLKLSVDTQEDLDFVRKIDAAQPRDFSLRATLNAVDTVRAIVDAGELIEFDPTK
jgi:spore coat polysaccharide biosynthesis protein SpsF